MSLFGEMSIKCMILKIVYTWGRVRSDFRPSASVSLRLTLAALLALILIKIILMDAP